MPDLHLQLAAAVKDLGVTPALLPLIGHDIAAGRLVCLGVKLTDKNRRSQGPPFTHHPCNA
jgi:hypothetical protein